MVEACFPRYRVRMDEEVTLHELRRLEAERKLRTIPMQVLDSAWVREAQIEAVIDAVLAMSYAADVAGYAHARHVGEWCARIASLLAFGPNPAFARRAGVLFEVDPTSLERIAELEYLARYVGEYQRCAIEREPNITTIALIIAIADEFDARITSAEMGLSASAVLRSMEARSSASTRPIVDALALAIRSISSAA